MSDKNCVIIKKTNKRGSEFSKTNRIRLDLFAFEQNEINQKKDLVKDCFSFSSQSFEEPKEKAETKITKQISIISQKTANDSLLMSSDEDESSDMSGEEEEEI